MMMVNRRWVPRPPQGNPLHLFDYLPKEAILAAYEKAAGRELDGKAESPESSSALVANTFGYFLDRASELPPLPGLLGAGWPATSVQLEANVRFPWVGGRHPWLDVLIETKTHLIGVESKRYEPYRGRHRPSFSDAYDRDVWAPEMKPYVQLKSKLRAGQLDLFALDASQLIKHALALATHSSALGKRPVLYYLYADPLAWPDGRPIPDPVRAEHAAHLMVFAGEVGDARVQFVSATYRQLLADWNLASPDLNEHVQAVRHHFSLPK